MDVSAGRVIISFVILTLVFIFPIFLVFSSPRTARGKIWTNYQRTKERLMREACTEGHHQHRWGVSEICPVREGDRSRVVGRSLGSVIRELRPVSKVRIYGYVSCSLTSQTRTGVGVDKHWRVCRFEEVCLSINQNLNMYSHP